MQPCSRGVASQRTAAVKQLIPGSPGRMPPGFLAGCLVYQGLPWPQWHHATLSPERDRTTTDRIKRLLAGETRIVCHRKGSKPMTRNSGEEVVPSHCEDKCGSETRDGKCPSRDALSVSGGD